MNNEFKKKLDKINLRNQYISILIRIFNERPEIFNDVCFRYSLTEEDMFDILSQKTNVKIPILDELALTAKELEKRKKLIK